MCHLPMNAVSYPASRRRRGNVIRVWLITSRPSLSLLMTRCLWAYCPVRKLARLGEQRGVVTKKLRNRTPSRARRSMFGDLANGWPVAPSESQR